MKNKISKFSHFVKNSRLLNWHRNDDYVADYKLGDFTMICAGAIVTRDYPSYLFATGISANAMKNYFKEF